VLVCSVLDGQLAKGSNHVLDGGATVLEGRVRCVIDDMQANRNRRSDYN
jgi:hypothetical protein